MVLNEPIKSFQPTPAVRRTAPAEPAAPPAEVAAEQPAIQRKRLQGGVSKRLESIQYRLAHRKVELGELRARTVERRTMLLQIQGELDQLSSPQDYLDNYEEIERLECLRATLQRDQDEDLLRVRATQTYQGQAMKALKTLRGGFWTRLASELPCRSEGPPPGSPW